MRDEMFHREYDQARDGLNDGLDRLVARIAEVFRSAERINFGAPWRRTLVR